jgi:hypothetical protein
MALGDILRRYHLGCYGTCCLRGEWGAVMKRLYGWVAIPLLLLGAVMLIAGIGATALWIAVIALGMALVVISQLPGAMARR